jgi:hypothetical protein
MNFVFNDGGIDKKKESHYARAISIITNIPPTEIISSIKKIRDSIPKRKNQCENEKLVKATELYIESLGFEWVACMQIGSGCKVHLIKEELPAGKILAKISGGYIAVIDGIQNDVFDKSRNGRRAVYGYWKQDFKGFIRSLSLEKVN